MDWLSSWAIEFLTLLNFKLHFKQLINQSEYDDYVLCYSTAELELTEIISSCQRHQKQSYRLIARSKASSCKDLFKKSRSRQEELRSRQEELKSRQEEHRQHVTPDLQVE